MTDDENEYRSADALFVVDEELLIVAWNDGAEELTGVKAGEAVGRPCWSVLAGRHDDGAVVCHAACTVARDAFRRRDPSARPLVVKSAHGERRVLVSTITAGAPGDQRLVHLLRPAPLCPAPARRRADIDGLTPRQHDVLELLGHGHDAREIAAILGVSVPTVRTHIRQILAKLGVRTQLAAVVRAFRLDR